MTDSSQRNDDRRTDAGPVVTVSNLGKRFGDVTVLDGVTFDVGRGTVTVLIGPNGSGKTTLLRTIAGLSEPDDGSVAVADDGTARRSIGYLPQRPAFRPTLTVAETLRFYTSLVDSEDVADRLAQVGLLDARDRRVDALSGGMVRLLGIAQATVGDPPLVVLDEPASGLDPEMTVHIFEVLADVAASGTAVLLSAHDLAAVETVADEVVLLDGGDVVVNGSVAEIVAATDAGSLSDAFSTLVATDADELTVRTGRVAGSP